MNPHDKLEEKLWDLVYELLSEEEAIELTRRIAADAEVAEACQRVRRQAQVLAAAARLERPPIVLVRPAAEPTLVPSEPRAAKPPVPQRIAQRASKPESAESARRAAASRWIVGLVSLLLLGLFAYAFWKPNSPLNARAQRSQELQLASRFVRTVVTGPAEVDPRTANTYEVVTTSVSGEPVPTDLEVRLYDSQATLRFQQSTQTNDQGLFRFDLPQDVAVADGRLEFETRAGDSREFVQTGLRLRGPEFSTYLTTDKPLYHPGETLFFRSVTLSRLGLEAANDLPVEFELRNPGGAQLPLDHPAGTTDNGVASGQFAIPAGLPGGRYTLVARSPSKAFEEQKREFWIREYRAPRLKKQLELKRDSYGPGDEVVADFLAERSEGGVLAGQPMTVRATVDGQDAYVATATTSQEGTSQIRFSLPATIERGDAVLSVSVDDGGTQETIAKTIPINLGKVEVAFYPEGGDLVAGLTSRVYFHAQDPLGKPAHIAGTIVDENDREVAQVETTHEGRGRFSITPRDGTEYRLRITRPANVAQEPRLPPPQPNGFLVLESAADLFRDSEPIQVRLRSSRPEVPLVVVAAARDVIAGQQALVARNVSGPLESGPVDTLVTLPLPDGVSGVLRVTVFDHASDPPVPVAERLVYRRPAKKLQLEANWSTVAETAQSAQQAPGKQPALTPGQRVRLTVRATQEDQTPTPAVLGVAVVDESVLHLADDKTPYLTTHFLLASHLEQPWELEDANFYLSEQDQAAESLDLLLGTQGWRRFTAERAPMSARRLAAFGRPTEPQPATAAALPLVFDNLPKVAAEYRRALATLRDTQAEELRDLKRLLSAGCLGVGLAAAIVGLFWLRIPAVRRSALRLGVVAVAGLVVGWLWTVRGVPLPDPRTAVAFAASNDGQAARGARRLARSAMDATAPDYDVDSDGMLNGRFFFDVDQSGNVDAGKLANRALFLGMNYSDVEFEFMQDAGDHFERFGLRGYRLRPEPHVSAESGRFPVRQYAHQNAIANTQHADPQRADFTETVLWHPLLISEENGEASVEFDLSDAVTRFRVSVEGHAGGRIGFDQSAIVSRIPFSLEPKLPLEVTAGDRIELPLAINNDSGRALPVNVEVRVGDLFRLVQQPADTQTVAPGERARQHVQLDVVGEAGAGPIEVAGKAAGFSDTVRREIRVVPPGFPVSWATGGNLQGEQHVNLELPPSWIPGSLRVSVTAFPSALADIRDGVEGILAEPHGCFEQASSANYPNIWALRFMQEHDLADPSFTRRAKEALKNGYRQLAGFECPKSGYEWFGGDPGHEALTAYGLMEFRDMQAVWDVDPQMVRRTAEWLLARRDGQGGFLRNGKALDSFGGAPPDITNAYIVWALTEAGETGIAAEIDHVLQHATESDDPYLVGLAANAAINATRPAMHLLDKLRSWQAEDGHLAGTRGSITRSGGISLQSETTSLAALAWLKASTGAAERPANERLAGESSAAEPPGTESVAAESARTELHADRLAEVAAAESTGAAGVWHGAAQRAVDWLVNHRQPGGGFGSTQATVLALKALVENARTEPRDVQDGALVVQVNGGDVSRTDFGARQVQPIRVQGLGSSLKPGQNELLLKLTGNNQMPYLLDVSYRAQQPRSAEACPVRLTTKLVARQARAGEIVGLEVELLNASEQAQPMTLAIVGLPAGLEARPEKLDELQQAGHFAYYEQIGRELAFYWRSLASPVPGQPAARFRLDLVAEIPGRYTGPASRTYLYYTPELKYWTEPLEVEITTPPSDGR